MSEPFSPLSRSIQRSNLQNFLHSVIPVVPSKLLPRNCIQDVSDIWQLDDMNHVEYFTLGDLWRSFDEWSAYGVGTPVELNYRRRVVQYYVPYISAIQIYTTKTSTILRNQCDEHIEAKEPEIELWSNGNQSDDVLARSLSNYSSRSTWDGSSEDSSPSCPLGDHLGHLYFQYHDVSSPYWRIPIADRIMDFMPIYPRLMSLKSIDLSPASWMSIAWYPIYHIPTKWYVKDLAACFLTYHTLSSFFQDSALDSDYEAIYRSKATEEPKEAFRGQISLPPFGLATYKMQGDVWINQNKYDEEKLGDLESAADSWLKQLNFHHHDFNFFKTHAK